MTPDSGNQRSGKFRFIVDILKRTFNAWRNDNASRLAAALAFYTTFSLAPILIIASAIAGAIVGNETVREQLSGEMIKYLGNQGTSFVLSLLDQARTTMTGQTATIIGLSAGLFGATVVFVELQNSLNQVWNVRPKRNVGWMYIVYIRLMSFIAVLILGLLLLLSVVLSAGVSAVNVFFSDKVTLSPWMLTSANFAVSFLLTALMFGIIFKVLPDVQITVRDIAIGAVLTAFLFTIGKMLIGMYLARSGMQSLYGAAGSFVVLLAWVYYSAQVFFFGAELCQVWSSLYGTGIKPNHYAEIDPCALDRLNPVRNQAGKDREDFSRNPTSRTSSMDRIELSRHIRREFLKSGRSLEMLQ